VATALVRGADEADDHDFTSKQHQSHLRIIRLAAPVSPGPRLTGTTTPKDSNQMVSVMQSFQSHGLESHWTGITGAADMIR